MEEMRIEHYFDFVSQKLTNKKVELLWSKEMENLIFDMDKEEIRIECWIENGFGHLMREIS